MANSAFRRPALFYSLFVALYDHMYGLKSPCTAVKPKQSLPSKVAALFDKTSESIKAKTLDAVVQDAMDKATANKAKRDVRHRYLMKALGLASAG
jgi:hypothetical protein